MNIIKKDLLSVEKGIICHQVNAQRTMGSGIAKAIRDKWPHVYEEYREFKKDSPDFCRLGGIQFVKINEQLEVCNIFGQLYYGTDGKRYTDYGALKEAFVSLRGMTANQVYFPMKFGSDRGGADWNIVSQMIDFYFPDAIICQL